MSDALQDKLADGYPDVSAFTFLLVDKIIATGIGANTFFLLQPQFHDLRVCILKKLCGSFKKCQTKWET